MQTVLSAMKDHSLRTELHAYRVLSNALTDAVEWGVLTVNPARGVKPRRVRGRSRALDVPDVATVARLVEAAEGSVYHIAFMLAAFTGLRRGEIVSLRWRDVDLEQGTLRVMRTAVLDGREITFDAPKNGKTREVELAPFLIEALRRHRREQAERRLALGGAWKDLDAIREGGDGQILHPDTVSQFYRRLAQHEGFGTVQFHDLRHAWVTRLLETGVHVKVVSEMAGHATVSFTMDQYGHKMPSFRGHAGSAMEQVYGG